MKTTTAISLVLVAVLALGGLTACSKDSEATTTNDKPVTVKESTTQTPAGDPTADSASEGFPVLGDSDAGTSGCPATDAQAKEKEGCGGACGDSCGDTAAKVDDAPAGCGSGSGCGGCSKEKKKSVDN
ncbi:MAG: hypothetical protein ACYS99_20120 [Planctomycetota bacterium]|jgi:hypothetical protein